MRFEDARNYKKQIKHLYRTAFPSNERAPLPLLFHRSDNGRDSFFAVLDNDEFIGLVYTIQTEKMLYVFFLAVTEDKRGKGYGSKIIHIIKKMYPEKVITLLIEDTTDKNADNLSQRLNRLKFYESNDFKQLNIKINEAGVNYELLGTATTITKNDFLALMKDYLGIVLFKIIYRKNYLK